MLLTLPSFAKINRTLEISGKRPDGHHEWRIPLQNTVMLISLFVLGTIGIASLIHSVLTIEVLSRLLIPHSAN
ncbi:MAG: hypothetical protein M3X11_06715, partial [Acidobacteriota bacterium]|nr:hypothetical protein [Acidobacteriota bacterium]